MTEDFPDRIKDISTARIQAGALSSYLAPKVERELKATAKRDPDLKTDLDKLGATGFIELGFQRLSEIEENYPDYYDALMERSAAMLDLAITLQPDYTEGVVNSYMTPGVARRNADKVSGQVKAKAFNDALKTSASLINFVSKNVLVDRQATDSPEQVFSKVTTEVGKIIEEGVVLHERRLEAKQVGAIVKGVIASINVADEEAKLSPSYNLNIHEAIMKQEGYYKKLNDNKANSDTP